MRASTLTAVLGGLFIAGIFLSLDTAVIEYTEVFVDWRILK